MSREREKVSVEELDLLYYRPEDGNERYDTVHHYLAYESGVYDKDENPIYVEVHEETDYVDLGKSYQQIIKVFKRITDGKFFKWSFTDSAYIDVEEDCDEEMIEVFPTTKTVEVTTYD